MKSAQFSEGDALLNDGIVGEEVQSTIALDPALLLELADELCHLVFSWDQEPKSEVRNL